MATSPVTSAPAPFEWPPLVSFYVPSPSTDDDDADADADDDDNDLEDFDTSFPADDFLDDSHDDWSDDRPDSSDDSDCSFDSDDCSAAWTTKSKRHPPHPRVHKKSSYHSACDYLSVFGALRKGFCSRPSDQRIEIPKPHGRTDMSTLPKADDSVQLEKKSVVLENRDSAGVILKDHKGALSFKCTAADTPKLLFSRAYASEDSNEEIIESENGPDARMVLDCDGEGSSKKPSFGQLKETVGNISAQKKYEDARAESGSRDSQVSSKSSLISSKSRISDENLILKEVDKSRKSRKASGKRSCPRESNREGSHSKDDSKLSTTGCSNKSLKHPNHAALTVNTLESQYKDCDSLENNASPPSMDLKEETSSFSDNLDEAVDVQTLVEKDVTDPEVPTTKSKLQDVPLQIYMKEKHQPEVVVKDPKRKAKAKKVKASKGKKLQLLRDGFTPPTETEPAEDADSAPFVVEKQIESNNKVQAPKIVVNNQILEQVVSTSAIEDDTQPPIVGEMENRALLPGSALGNGMEVVDGVPLRDSTVPVATSKVIKSQPGNLVSNDSDHAGLVLPDTPSKGSSFSSASYQNVEDGDGSDLSSIEALHDSQPLSETQISGVSEKNLLRNGITSALPPTEVSSRRWSSHSAVASHDQADLKTSINGSLSVPDLLVGNSPAASMLNSSSTSLSHDPDLESECLKNIQGNTDCSPSPNSPFMEAPSAAYYLGKRVLSRAIGSSTPRTSTTGTSNIQFNQVPVSQNVAYAPNSVSTTSLQQELSPPALFHIDSRASVPSTWIQPGTSSGPGFSFPLAPVGTSCIGQVIGCNNQTLSMYKQMKSFSIEARYLVDAPSIVPGCCKLFLFNIESRQLHGVYVSSSLQAMPIDHECPVAFDCIENYSHPLSVGELDGVLPEAKNMDGRPLFLQPHTVEQLATLFQRKHKPRLSWVPSISNPVSVSGVHGLPEFSTIASEIPCNSHDPLAEEVGQGPFGISAASEVARDPWSSFSSGYSGKVPEYGPERIASEPDSQLGTARIFPFPASSIINVEGVQSVRPEISQSGLARKLPVQGVAPSPMALWPHLFPKGSVSGPDVHRAGGQFSTADGFSEHLHQSVLLMENRSIPASSTDSKKESFMHMETREGSSTQKNHASLSEMIDMGARPDTECEAVSFSPLPESGLQSTAHRPKSVYNPLAVEQGRQRHLFDSSKPWSPLASELDLQQYGSRPRSQDKIFNAPLSSPSSSEQSMMSNISGGAPVQLSAAASSQLPLHYQVEHALPDSLKDDLGLSRTGTRQSTSAWNEDLHLQHLPTTRASVAGAVDLDQTNMCCYCFTRRADHLIIDCQHLGPCVECAASKKIEYCGHCQTKVTRLLRLFRPV